MYDGECPFCARYARLVDVRDAVGELVFVNARDGGPVVDEVRALPWDLNQGMALKLNGRYRLGDEALHTLALLSRKKGAFGVLHRLALGSRAVAWLAYPLLKLGRRLALRAKKSSGPVVGHASQPSLRASRHRPLSVGNLAASLRSLPPGLPWSAPSRLPSKLRDAGFRAIETTPFAAPCAYTDRVKSRVLRMQARIDLQSASQKKACTCSGAPCKNWKAASRLARSWASILLSSRRDPPLDQGTWPFHWIDWRRVGRLKTELYCGLVRRQPLRNYLCAVNPAIVDY